MLVLSRKTGEKVIIGDEIKVTVLDQRSGQVRLGFEAPKEITVHREEIFLKIQQEEPDNN